MERYLNYPDIKRYVSAKKIENNIGQINQNSPFYKHAKNLVEDQEEKKKVAKKFKTFWPELFSDNDPKKLRHWSGIDSARSRAVKFLGDDGKNCMLKQMTF